MKHLVIRFDCDTELCLRQGMPQLLELGSQLSVSFTFFINPGRTIRRRDLFFARLGNRAKLGHKLSPAKKLGGLELMYLVAVNPRPLPRHVHVLRRAEQQGHEIALHGGRNHGEWARQAHKWTAERIASEVDFGLRKLEEAGVARPKLFASPGWNSPPRLPGILRERGILGLADSHGDTPIGDDSESGITHLHTALTGEPGGIGYLEFMRAQDATDEAILEDFATRLGRETRFACVYDHPFYAGCREINLLRKMILLAREQGWRVEPMGSALPAERHQ